MWTCPACNQKFIRSNQTHSCNEKTIEDFLKGKSAHTLSVFTHFISEYKKIAPVSLHPAKTRIAFVAKIRFGYIHRLGKNYIDVVLQFNKPYTDNYCFHKIANVPDSNIYNHYMRLYSKDDINDEIKKYMQLAYENGNKKRN